MILTKVWQDLKQNRVRSILTILGLAVAVIGIVGFPIATQSVQDSVVKQYGASPTDYQINIRSAEWNENVLDEFDEIFAIDPILNRYSSTEIGGESNNIFIMAMDLQAAEDRNSQYSINLKEGNFPAESENQILIEHFDAKNLGISVGDDLELELILDNGTLKSFKLTVSGTVQTIDSSGDGVSTHFRVYIDRNTYNTLLGQLNVCNQVNIALNENTMTIEEKVGLMDSIVEKLEDTGYFIESYSYVEGSGSWRDNMLSDFSLAVTLTSILGLIVGGILAASTIQMTIAQELKDIAIMKILGGQKHHIFTIYLTESVILGALGSLVGLTLTLGGSYGLLLAMKDMMGLSEIMLSVTPLNIILGAAIPLGTSVLFSIPAILRTLKIRPIEVFREKSTQLSGKGVSRVKNPKLVYSLKNIRASRGRMISVGCMIALAIATMVGFTIGVDSLNVGMHQSITNHPANIIMYSSEPLNKTIAIETMDNFISTNARGDQIFEYTPFMKTYPLVQITDDFEYMISSHGVLPNDSLILNSLTLDTDYNGGGRLIEESDAGKNNIVITGRYLQALEIDATIGDNLTIKFGSTVISCHIIGIVKDYADGGLTMYIHQESLQEIYSAPGLINSIYVKLEDGTQDVSMAEELSKHNMVSAYGWTVYSGTFMREMFSEIGNIFSMLNIMVSFLVIIVTIIGGGNIFTMAIMERRRDIGILKIQGATPRWIFTNFLIESIIVSAFGCIFGILLGYFAIAPMWNYFAGGASGFDIPFTANLYVYLMAIGVALIAGLTATILPGRNAARTPPIEGIRYE